MSETMFDRLGADRLREIVTDFYSRVVPDVMIGYMFAGKDKAQLIQREWELVAALLGGDVKYTGRPMRMAHAAHTIFEGHFNRRLQILKDTLRDHAVPDDIAKVWIDHSLALREQVTRAKIPVVPPPPDPDAPVKLGRKS